MERRGVQTPLLLWLMGRSRGGQPNGPKDTGQPTLWQSLSMASTRLLDLSDFIRLILPLLGMPEACWAVTAYVVQRVKERICLLGLTSLFQIISTSDFSHRVFKYIRLWCDLMKFQDKEYGLSNLAFRQGYCTPLLIDIPLYSENSVSFVIWLCMTCRMVVHILRESFQELALVSWYFLKMWKVLLGSSKGFQFQLFPPLGIPQATVHTTLDGPQSCSDKF